MKLRDICNKLEEWAPLAYQESYDNSGLIVGDPETDVKGVLVSLDCLECVVDEAISKDCNVVVSHHPIVFAGLKSLTGKNYVERTVLKAIKNNIALYAIHTNLDNVDTGVNKMIADRLSLQNVKILEPKKDGLKMLITYVPNRHVESVCTALFAQGAGSIGEYSECHFSVDGIGTFKGSDNSNPVVGQKGVRESVSEQRIELVFPSYIESKVVSTLKTIHPYEEVAYSVLSLNNKNENVGSGMIGEISEPLNEMEFLKNLKIKLKTDCIRHTSLLNSKIKKVAICGGSGRFLLNAAKQSGADVFITSDFKYHEFFEAENRILLADIGHYESEQFTIKLIADFLNKNFPRFAVHLSKVNTNPINYL